MRRLHVLVEGQTEETFVRNLLAPHLKARALHPVAVLLKTKRVKSGGAFRGGVTSTRQVLGDLKKLLGDSGAAAVTTVIDYYGLPIDFPGISTRPNTPDPYARVEHVERAFAEAAGRGRFIPHLTLHEYETWIYSSPEKCGWVFRDPTVTGRLAEIRDRFGSAEQINEQPQTCPSRQLANVYPSYQKALEGPMAVEAIGLASLRAACPHADAWLRELERL